MPKSAELTEPVVHMVVITVHKVDVKPPNRVSMPGATEGIAGINARTRQIPARM